MSNSNSDILELINQFFEKIYVISLDRDEHRRKYIKKQFSSLEFSFFSAYDGKKLNAEQLEQENIYDKQAFINKRWDKTEPTSNVIGCALSHLEVSKDIVKNNYRNALILEDDILLKKIGNIERVFKELPEDWELLYLGYHQNEAMPLSFRLKHLSYYRLYNLLIRKKYNLRELRCHYPRKYSENLRYAGRHYGTYAYGISKRGAQKYINIQTPLIQESDHALGELCYKELVKAFVLKKKLIKPNLKFESSRGYRF